MYNSSLVYNNMYTVDKRTGLSSEWANDGVG